MVAGILELVEVERIQEEADLEHSWAVAVEADRIQEGDIALAEQDSLEELVGKETAQLQEESCQEETSPLLVEASYRAGKSQVLPFSSKGTWNFPRPHPPVKKQENENPQCVLT